MDRRLGTVVLRKAASQSLPPEGSYPGSMVPLQRPHHPRPWLQIEELGLLLAIAWYLVGRLCPRVPLELGGPHRVAFYGAVQGGCERRLRAGLSTWPIFG